MRKLLLIFFLIGSFCSLAQESDIKNSQRAIFIYNFARQIGWPVQFKEFIIGVLGDDQAVFEELKKMQRAGRTVQGQNLRVVKFNKINAIGEVQLIYVNKKFNYDISELLRQVRGKNILIVSEGYGFNQSMINMINISNSFQFEINQTRLNLENFTVPASLKETAISTAERWQTLYLESTQSLEEERRKVEAQKEQLSEQSQLLTRLTKKIEDQINQIDGQNLQIERLKVEYNKLDERSAEQLEVFAMREKELIKMEAELLRQQKEIADKRKEVEGLDETLEGQKQLILQQNDKIEDQLAVLRAQRAELDYQKNFIILFIILTAFAITAGVFIFRSYRIKKKSNKELAEKNAAIEAKSKELEIKSEEMEQFAYVASHDLQEPLNTITSWMSLIKTEGLDDTGKQSYKFILESTERMRKLIRGLLEYSKSGSNTQSGLIDLNTIVDTVKANLFKVIADSGSTIHHSRLPTITGYEVEITLLFQNLINNAVKFRKDGVAPVVEIKANEIKGENGEKMWEIAVADNGIGIPAQHKDKIFGIFKRLHSQSKYQGTGIGLAHCKKIVELHKGSIWVESEEGKGSTFFFTLKG